MKFITFVILAILALCAIASEARPRRLGHKFRLMGKGRGGGGSEVDVAYRQYSSPDCSGDAWPEYKETGDCITPFMRKSERIGTVKNGKLSIECIEGNCGGSPSKVLYFENDVCTKDEFTGHYVRWSWSDNENKRKH